MRTLVDKINYFETKAGTVSEFNSIFPAKLTGLDQSLLVEIGELSDTDTTRFITVGDLILKYNFTQKTGEEKNV